MASLATFVNRFVGVRELADAPPAVWTRTDAPRLRPIANEDVYLFVKRIDNSTVVRAVDLTERRTRGRTVITAFIAAMLVIAGLAPQAYNTVAGFTLESLQQEQEKLQKEQAILEMQEAQLLSPARLEQLAKSLKMAEPIAQQVQFLEGKSRNPAARNALPSSGTGALRR